MDPVALNQQRQAQLMDGSCSAGDQQTHSNTQCVKALKASCQQRFTLEPAARQARSRPRSRNVPGACSESVTSTLLGRRASSWSQSSGGALSPVNAPELIVSVRKLMAMG